MQKEKKILTLDEMIIGLESKREEKNKKIQILKNDIKKIDKDLETLKLKKENEELKKKLNNL